MQRVVGGHEPDAPQVIDAFRNCEAQAETGAGPCCIHSAEPFVDPTEPEGEIMPVIALGYCFGIDARAVSLTRSSRGGGIHFIIPIPLRRVSASMPPCAPVTIYPSLSMNIVVGMDMIPYVLAASWLVSKYTGNE